MKTLKEYLALAQEKEQQEDWGTAKLLIDEAIQMHQNSLAPEERERLAQHSAELLGQLLATLPEEEDEEDDGLLTIDIPVQ